ncbi:MAG: hypothetical protein AAF382_06760 [Pseudomonadota bacterium]
MADTSSAAPTQSLGVGALISESFSILFGNIPTVIMIGFVPMFISAMIGGLLNGWGTLLGTTPPDFTSMGSIVMFIISMVLQFGIYGIMIALLVQMAYDVKLGRKPNISRYFGPAMNALVPLLLVSIVTTILIGIGFAALIVPGLWLYAVFSVVVPAIVIESAGFGALGRSSALTKDFRWPIVGLLVVIVICMVIIGAIFGAGLGLIIYALGDGFVGIVFMVLLVSVINGFTYSLSGISVSLIYARLREIKEGVGVDQLASVFE